MPGRVLLTGVSSGIGAAVAQRLLADGWAVIGLSRSRPAFAHPALDHVVADLSDRAALADVLGGIAPVQALVHAAGVLRVGALGRLDPGDGREMWRLHVDAAAQLMEHVAPGLQPGGRVVLIGSRTAAGSAGRSQYAATKAALVGLARSWAIELAPLGITVNVVAPGATETPMLNDPARSAVAPKRPPSGRFVQPEEVAAMTAFLLSDSARSITGQQIVICGGASL